jgi:hypothetical protein
MLNRKEATIRWRLAEARNMFQEIWVKRRDAKTSPIPKTPAKSDGMSA